MLYFIILNIKFYGVLLKFFFLLFIDVKMIRNDGSGFVYESYWDKINIFVVEMVSVDVNKILYVCLKNRIFLLFNKVFYFSLEVFEWSLNFRCQYVMEIQFGYKIVFQSFYYSFLYGNLKCYFLYVYDGVNVLVGLLWMMEVLLWKNCDVYR